MPLIGGGLLLSTSWQVGTKMAHENEMVAHTEQQDHQLDPKLPSQPPPFRS